MGETQLSRVRSLIRIDFLAENERARHPKSREVGERERSCRAITNQRTIRELQSFEIRHPDAHRVIIRSSPSSEIQAAYLGPMTSDDYQNADPRFVVT